MHTRERELSCKESTTGDLLTFNVTGLFSVSLQRVPNMEHKTILQLKKTYIVHTHTLICLHAYISGELQKYQYIEPHTVEL